MKIIDGVRFMRTVDVGRECKFKDIKVGEVFAFDGCWQVHIKVNKKESLIIAIDDEKAVGFELEDIDGSWTFSTTNYNINKLPLSFQKNFIDWR